MSLASFAIERSPEPRRYLSPLHGALEKIGRQRHAKSLNRIINDPSVYPWVHGAHDGPMDLSEIVADPRNVLLMGRHGGVLFVELQPGIFEAHTQVLPEGRGRWTLSMVKAALHWMFTRTSAVEILTKVPKGNIAAKALAKAIGGQFEFLAVNGWIKAGSLIPAEIWALRLQDWAKGAPGLIERGQWFHDRLDEEFERAGITEPNHEDDEVHDRYVGMAAEMVLGGEPEKAMIFYNRWAKMAGYEPMTLVSIDPLTIDIKTALLAINGENFEVTPCR